MRALLQRVKSASVAIDNKEVAAIGGGYLVLLGVKSGDTEAQAEFLAKKTAELRVFSDSDGKMNLSLCDIGGDVLVVSQFTLCADCRHGRRPSFIGAMQPDKAEQLYLDYVDLLRRRENIGSVKTGVFGADMLVSLQNDGPVTILLDTDEIMK